MLLMAGGSPGMIQQAASQSAGLGLFIRSLVGMDRDAVVAAFSTLTSGSTTRPDQIKFIDIVIDELSSNGVMDARRRYKSPFLDISPQGPQTLFALAQVQALVHLLDDFRQRASA